MFKYLLHGHQTLSLLSGVIVNDLVVSCGCSLEKLPMIITNVVTLFFGTLPKNVTDQLSSSIANLTYDYSKGPVGKQRVRVCMMHIFECELKVLTTTLLRQQGLKHDATPAQNMYSLSHIMETLHNEFLALGVISEGGDVRNIDDCPKEIKNLYQKSADGRWITKERGGDQLHGILDIAATDKLIEHTAQYYGGTNSEEWNKIAERCTCIDEDSLQSFIILGNLYLANHTPNGKRGDGYKNCTRLVACWTAPLQRVATRIVGELYSVHIEWAKFADGTSGTHGNTTKVISTRMLELATFERRQVYYLWMLFQDWRALLPRSAALLVKEASRAVRLGFSSNEQEIIDAIDKLMKTGTLPVHYTQYTHKHCIYNILSYHYSSGTTECVKSFSKYLKKSLLNRGWCICMLTDPYLAPYVAAGILDGLGIQVQAVRGVPADSIPAAGDPVLDKLNSNTHAFPSVTFQELRAMVKNMFTQTGKSEEEKKEIVGIIHAYGLSYQIIAVDMQKLASGALFEALQSPTSDWSLGKGPDQYWGLFQFTFPGIADSLHHQLSHVLVASTVVEQLFSKLRNITHQNQSNSSVQQSANFMMNVKQPVTSEQRYISTEGPQRLLRNKVSRVNYLTTVTQMTSRLQGQVTDQTVQSCRKMTGEGKRKRDLSQSMPYVLQEFAASEISPQKGFGSAELIQLTQEMHDTYLNGGTTLPSTVAAAAASAAAAAAKANLTGLEALAAESRWTAVIIRKYLQSKDKTRYKNVKNVLLNAKAEGDQNLRQLLVEYWTSINISEREIAQIDLTTL